MATARSACATSDALYDEFHEVAPTDEEHLKACFAECYAQAKPRASRAALEALEVKLMQRAQDATAREAGRQGMLLFFEADSCPYCRQMRRNVFANPDVQEWFGQRFVSIAVDIHGDVELTDFDGITLPSKVFADHRKVFLTPDPAHLHRFDAQGLRIG